MHHKISIIGMGYVGCGNALLFSKDNQVSIVDIDLKKVEDFNSGKLPIFESKAQNYFEEETLDISATTDFKKSIEESSYVIFALPTNFDEKIMKFDTRILDDAIANALQINKKATLIIKSTVDIGHTEYLRKKHHSQRIIFSPEFLREGHALEDSLHPSRIIIGGTDKTCEQFAELMRTVISSASTTILMMRSNEAESVKLFSNTYLAMRVAFFNELDSFCFDNNIDPKDVINGICLDDRIGSYYNNPSFGFGGLCLPKDSLQLLSRFKDSPKHIINAIQDSNTERASYLVDKIMAEYPKTIGIYKLAMKAESDNSRNSSILQIISGLVSKNVDIIIYDDSTNFHSLEGARFVKDFEIFAEDSDLIIANRLDSRIKKFSNKVFSRDIFSKD
jgi:UDPglucose 6-dehydrogenase